LAADAREVQSVLLSPIGFCSMPISSKQQSSRSKMQSPASLPQEAPMCFLEEGDAHEALKRIEPETVQLVNFSPPYLDVVDYDEAGAAEDNCVAWKRLANEEKRKERGQTGREEGEVPVSRKVEDYVSRHLQTTRLIYAAMARDSTLCLEIDDYRVSGAYRLVPLVDLWCRMLEACGLRIAEKIVLGRKIAVSRRGAQLMRTDGTGARPGYFAPANVTSTLVVAMKGEPQARLRRDGRRGDGFDREWAQQYVKSLWMLRPPVVEGRRRDRSGHPCPQDLDVARAAVRFYSLRGDMVLDPYAGEGTTGVAAIGEGRHATLVERVPYFCDLIRENLQDIGVEAPKRIGASEKICVPGAQLYLPLVDETLERAIEEAAYPGHGRPTKRHEQMARTMTRLLNREVPASLVSVFLRGERAHYNESRST